MVFTTENFGYVIVSSIVHPETVFWFMCYIPNKRDVAVKYNEIVCSAMDHE